MSFQVKSFETLVQDMVSWVIANSPQISDLTPGSVLRSIIEGLGLSVEELYVSVYLGFRRYLDNIQETAFDFDRKDGTKATTDVVFSRGTPAPADIAIPIGTKLKTASGLVFFTTELATILLGNTDSNSVEAEAEETGISYNVAPASITVISDSIDGVETVTNALAAVGGVSQETDYEFKKRFQSYIEGLGRANVAGLIVGALSVEGITSASVVEYFPPVANVNARIYIDDGSATGVTGFQVTAVQDIIDGDGTQDNPGYRAAGVNVIVAAPGIVTQAVTMTITPISGVDTDQMKIDIAAALTSYVNTLGVGADIIYNELVASVMGVYGVEDCSITVPAANVSVASTQVGRLGVVTITV